MIDEKKILNRIKQMEAYAALIQESAIQLKKDLEHVDVPAPKGGITERDRAIMRKKLRKIPIR